MAGVLTYAAVIAARADALYPSTVLADGPVAYWRFTDVIFSSVSAVAANSGTAGASLNGTYPAAAGLAGAGPQPPSETGFETTNSAVNLTNDFVGAPPLMLKTNTITFEAWINP
jgi:hypothetical protein